MPPLFWLRPVRAEQRVRELPRRVRNIFPANSLCTLRCRPSRTLLKLNCLYGRSGLDNVHVLLPFWRRNTNLTRDGLRESSLAEPSGRLSGTEFENVL